MKRLVIQKTISLEHKHLGHLIDEKIKEKLQTITSECTPEYGYVLSVGEFRIVDTFISRATTEPIIKVVVSVTALKPEIGKIYPCVVSACVDGNGIYAFIYEKLHTRIVEKVMDKDWIHTAHGYRNSKTGKTISIGDTINVCIAMTKYENNNFLCIATLA